MTEKFEIPTPVGIIGEEATRARAEAHAEITIKVWGDTLPDGDAVVFHIPNVLLLKPGQLTMSMDDEQNPHWNPLSDDSWRYNPERKRLTLRIDSALIPQTENYDGVDYTIRVEKRK